MANKLWETTLFNYYTSSLATGMNANASIIYLPSGASGLVSPGILLLDQYNNAGALTTLLREWVSFTTVTTAQDKVSGITRGLGGSASVAHAIGARVEAGLSVTHWGDMIDYLQAEHTAAGRHVIGTATITYTETPQLAVTSTASIAVLNISSHFGASGASLYGIPDNPITVKFSFIGSTSGPTTSPQLPMIMPISGTWDWVSVIAPSIASAASVIFDINKNGTSIFDTGTRPFLVGAGSFVSSASIATKAFSRGDQISWDFDGPASVGGLISDFNMYLHSL